MSSIYTQLLIEALNVSLNNTSTEKFKYLLKTNKFSWPLLRQKSNYHGITPILFNAVARTDKSLVDSDYFEEIKHRSIRQFMFNLSASQEMLSLLSFLEHHHINVIPFKGVLFVHELYDGKSIRESTDLDILVRREDASKALNLLIEKADYQFLLPDYATNKYTTDELISGLLAVNGHHEVGLKKEGSVINVDFHWDAFEDFYQYQLPAELLFKDRVDKYFFNSICTLPSNETIFWMLIIHHGGREIWSRLKYFGDLLVFYQKYKDDIDWKKIVLDAENFKMKRIVVNGFYCLEILFNIESPEPIKGLFITEPRLKKNYKRILNFWDMSQNRNASFITKIKSYFLYFFLQDPGFSYSQHSKHSFLKRSIPNLLEADERIIVFPQRFIILNFFGKIASALAIYIGIKERH